MIEKLRQDMVKTMKEKDKDRLTILRQIKAAVDMEHIDKKREITDELLIDVVAHQLKILNDSVKEFEKGNRLDLVEKARREIKVLNEYLPTPLTEDEVDCIIADAFEKIRPQSMRDMGTVMKEITPTVKGRFDMSSVSSKIKNKLN